MSQEDRCKHCGGYLVKCRNPNQRYCCKPECQKQRKNLWRRNKLNTDCDYKSNQTTAGQKWRESNKTYWKNYRASHPDYVMHNREQQRIRDNKKHNASHLAKSDASTSKNNIISGSYCLTPINETLLAKSDALLVKITLITNGYADAVTS